MRPGVNSRSPLERNPSKRSARGSCSQTRGRPCRQDNSPHKHAHSCSRGRSRSRGRSPRCSRSPLGSGRPLRKLERDPGRPSPTHRGADESCTSQRFARANQGRSNIAAEHNSAYVGDGWREGLQARFWETPDPIRNVQTWTISIKNLVHQGVAPWSVTGSNVGGHRHRIGRRSPRRREEPTRS